MSTLGLRSHDLDVEALRPARRMDADSRRTGMTSNAAPSLQAPPAALSLAYQSSDNPGREQFLVFSGSRSGAQKTANGQTADERARFLQAKADPMPSRKQRSSKPYNTFIQPKFIQNESDLGELVKEHQLRDKEISSIALEKPAHASVEMSAPPEAEFQAGETGDTELENSKIQTQEKQQVGPLGETDAEVHNEALNAVFEPVTAVSKERLPDYPVNLAPQRQANEPLKRAEAVQPWTQPSFVENGRAIGNKSERQKKFPSREELEQLISPSAHEAPLRRVKAPSPEEPRRSKSKLERGLQKYNRSFRAHEEKQREKELVKQSSQILAQSRQADEYKQGYSLINPLCREDAGNARTNARTAALWSASPQGASPGIADADVVGFISASDIQYMQTLVESLREENARLKECRPDQLRRDVEQKEKAIQGMLASGPHQQIREEIVRISREIQHLKQQLGQE